MLKIIIVIRQNVPKQAAPRSLTSVCVCVCLSLQEQILLELGFVSSNINHKIKRSCLLTVSKLLKRLRYVT